MTAYIVETQNWFLLMAVPICTLQFGVEGCYEAKIEKRLAVTGSQTQDTSGLNHQCSATEPQQPDNHQPSQSFICTVQVVLNPSVAYLAATRYVPSELRYTLTGKFSPLGKNAGGVVFSLQLLITYMFCVEAFATGIKIESSDQSPFGGLIRGLR